ncbi:MAG: hypothetical protein KAQ64_04130 [Candidatus Pacebacteria bacterium]|nr:hypothetical protein [Candidatus Paceibacterota bacterium]
MLVFLLESVIKKDDRGGIEMDKGNQDEDPALVVTFVVLSEMPVLRITPERKTEIEKFFEGLSELVPPAGDEWYDNVQKNIGLMEEFLLGDEADLMSLKQITDDVVVTLEDLAEKIEQSGTEEFIAEYSEKWAQIKKSLMEEVLKHICEQCPKKNTCNQYNT